jgi:hypothetical protein
MSVECYRLNDRGNWEFFHYFDQEENLENPEIEVHLAGIDLRFPLSWIYENIEFVETEH